MARELISQLGYLGIGVKDANTWEDFGQNILSLELYEKRMPPTLLAREAPQKANCFREK